MKIMDERETQKKHRKKQEGQKLSERVRAK